MSIIKNRKIWLTISTTLFIAGVVALAVWGLRLGVDFTGGTNLEVNIPSSPPVGEVETVVNNAIHIENTVQAQGQTMMIRSGPLTEEQHQQVLTALKATFHDVTEVQFNSIGPSVGQEVKSKSIMAVILVTLVVLFYIAWSFRSASVPVSSWIYAIVVIITFVHDVVIPVGIISILTHFYGWEINSPFIAAVLTILGYSINDTIVVFDRVRENLRKMRGSFEEIVERSVRQSAIRSINTSVTTMLALTAIYFFGGESTKLFALTLLLGIFFGTYSSIFIASPLLVIWNNIQRRRR